MLFFLLIIPKKINNKTVSLSCTPLKIVVEVKGILKGSFTGELGLLQAPN